LRSPPRNWGSNLPATVVAAYDAPVPPTPLAEVPMRLLISLLACGLAGAAAAADPVTRGTVPVSVAGDEAARVPPEYRLKAEDFAFEARVKYDLRYSGVEVIAVTFPTALPSAFAVNNTVHCEYFRPKGLAKPGPAVIVLDILDGAGVVSRGQAMWLAVHGVPAICMTMPYYGPRRPDDKTAGKQRFLSMDVASSLDHVRQCVLDARRAVAWLATQPDVDPAKLGLVGTSLGSFMGGIVAASEPRITSASLLLGGGGLVDAFAEHPQGAAVFAALRVVGLSKATLQGVVARVDPITYAEQLKAKRLLLIAASRDDIVPPVAMRQLWRATGEPKILWYDATHVGSAQFVFPMMNAVLAHIRDEK